MVPICKYAQFTSLLSRKYTSGFLSEELYTTLFMTEFLLVLLLPSADQIYLHSLFHTIFLPESSGFMSKHVYIEEPYLFTSSEISSAFLVYISQWRKSQMACSVYVIQLLILHIFSLSIRWGVITLALQRISVSYQISQRSHTAAGYWISQRSHTASEENKISFLPL